MRFRRIIWVVSITTAFAGCDSPPPFCGGRLADACRKAQDLGYLAGVELGDEGASGNAILGQAGAIGTTGKARVSVRVSGMKRETPQMANVVVRTDSSAGASTIRTGSELGTSISIDGAIGGASGARMGDSRIGGLDLLGSITAMPNSDRGSLQVGGSPVTLGIGVRLGILAETRTMPAVSLTASARTPRRFTGSTQPLPTDSGERVRLELHSGKITTLGLRLASSKQVGRFGVTAGIGQDTYYASVGYAVTGGGTLGTGSESESFKVTRTNAFAGASYSAGRVTFATELGRLAGGHVPPMLNAFGSRSVTAPHSYVTLGVRIPAGRTNDRD
jgi:hypothetical protein